MCKNFLIILLIIFCNVFILTSGEETRPNACSCIQNHCSCCTNFLLSQFNNHGCFNLTYDVNESKFFTVISLNDRILYKNDILSRNPRPICVRIPRINAFRLCLRFYNLYVIKRNIHVCIDMVANWQKVTFVRISFDCIRFGSNGFAIVSPESGGGLPIVNNNHNELIDENYDYDDSA